MPRFLYRRSFLSNRDRRKINGTTTEATEYRGSVLKEKFCDPYATEIHPVSSVQLFWRKIRNAERVYRRVRIVHEITFPLSRNFPEDKVSNGSSQLLSSFRYRSRALLILFPASSSTRLLLLPFLPSPLVLPSQPVHRHTPPSHRPATIHPSPGCLFFSSRHAPFSLRLSAFLFHASPPSRTIRKFLAAKGVEGVFVEQQYE